MNEGGSSARDGAGLDRRFRELRASPSTERRNELVLEHLEVANALARRFADRGEPIDDLEQVARVALVGAVERFDPDQGVPFVGFAVPTITGALKRHFRDRTWGVGVPRRVKDLVPTVRRTVEELGATRDRVTAGDVAEALGLDLDVVLEVMEAAGSYRPDSLDVGPVDVDGPTATGETDELTRVVDREALRALLETLPERDRRVVVLACYAEWTQDRIARELGVSQMTVSRIVRRSLDTLHASLTADDRLPPDAAG
ncbi:MAG: sigma-70 family RNA polymerase sigma factor [Acidimicrobiales bacterium]|nr:sigma-70 family RNA polymerase sigma factor [Acidimicrobiales bacterium]